MNPPLFMGVSALTVSRAVEWNTVKNQITRSDTGISSAEGTLTCSEFYAFDAADKLTSISGDLWGVDGSVTVTYNTASATKATETVAFPWNGSLFTKTRAFSYTDTGRLSQVTVDSARTIAYSWDASGTGDLASVTDGGVTTAFTYLDGHLLSAVTGSDVTTYTFDTGGRRTGETGPSGSAGMAWTGDDYLASYVASDSANVRVVDASYVYDGNGQRLSASVTATSAFSPDTAVATAYTYAWEGTDLAVFTAASSEGSASVSYLFDESDRPYAAAVSFTGLGGSEETTSAAIRLLTNDHGDILALADASGEVFARYTYGPFGEAEGAETRATALLSADEAALIAEIQPLRYAGYCFDTWSGDYYLQARYYDPETKQFLSKDPDKADGEESAYQYCSGDPVNATDPTGMWTVNWKMVGKGALKALGAVAVGALIGVALTVALPATAAAVVGGVLLAGAIAGTANAWREVATGTRYSVNWKSLSLSRRQLSDDERSEVLGGAIVGTAALAVPARACGPRVSGVRFMQSSRRLTIGRISKTGATKSYPGVLWKTRAPNNGIVARSLELHTPHQGHGVHVQGNNWRYTSMGNFKLGKSANKTWFRWNVGRKPSD